ncbi:MAG: hypothetical protein K5928_07920, partial [Prevotella sp.]|nr:hypothetical protein [Prevotella sp.]
MKKIFTLLGLALLGVSSASAETYLSGSFNNWGSSDVFISNSVTISLAASTEYQFKVVDGNSWLGNDGTMYWNNCTEWAFDSDANCKIRTLEAGDYVFTWSDGKLSVTYPTITS